MKQNYEIVLKALGHSTDLFNNWEDEIISLFHDLEENIIDASEVSERLECMKRKDMILNRQKEFCGIWLASDGRYKTKVPTADGGKKLIAKPTLENLENYIIEYYKQLDKKDAIKKPTMRSIYPEWIDYKSKETSYANATNIQSRWKRYFSNSTIIDIPLENLTTGAIRKWCVDTVYEMKLTNRQFKDLKSIMNMLFDYAVSFDIIQVNLARQIRGFSYRMFKQEEIKPDNEIVFFEDAQDALLKKALGMYLKTQNSAYLAICLNFTLGLRVGELVALRMSHINLRDKTITINQEEVKTYYKDEKGAIHRNGYEIVDHTKTLNGNRKLPLTPKAIRYIKMIDEYNKTNQLQDEDFLFIGKSSGKRIHDSSINTALRRINGGTRDNTCGTEHKPNGNHSIRKTVISKLHDSMQFSDDTIKNFAGHKDISTTQKCYIHQVNEMSNYTEKFAKVLDS